MKKTWIVVLIAVLMMALLAGIGTIVVGTKLDKLHDQSIQIVEKPDVVVAPTPAVKVDETLVEVEGTPEDIGEDYEPELTEEDEIEQKPIFKADMIDEDVINVLLVGQDTGLDWNRSTRSDSCMILSYDRRNNSVKMVSIMRDIWVPIEGHGWNRINAAYSFGGAGLLINTLNEIYDLDIQNYVITGFDEFKEVIDQLGGLDMELTAKEAAYLNSYCGTHFKEGTNHLNGAQALVHARNRRTGDGDFGRVRRQRNLILTAYNKLRSSKDIASYAAFLEFGLNHVKTNMDAAQILTLGLEGLQAENLDIAYAHLPFDGTWSYATKNGKAVLAVDLEENKDLLREFLYGNQDENEE